VAKHWETIVEKLKADGWEVRWVEAMHDAESGWTATAIRGKERHSNHANDITLAFQELEASCSPLSRNLQNQAFHGIGNDLLSSSQLE
jgi:hypothetical protein